MVRHRRVAALALKRWLWSTIVVLAVASSPGIATAGRPPTAGPGPTARVDLAPELAADGTFIGAPGVSGSVDPTQWTLVSNLASGEPPRFARSTTTDQTVDPQGNEWLNLGSNGSGDGALNGRVMAIQVNDLAVIVAGDFTNVAGIPQADYIADWSGSRWRALGSNRAGDDGALNGPVRAMASYDQNLYVGGDFTNAYGIPQADYLARWTGNIWTFAASQGAVDGDLNGPVDSLIVSGTGLFVGGAFTDAAGIAEADYLGRWDGWDWWATGSDGNGNGALNAAVETLAPDGTGGVYAGGLFADAGGIAEADYVARWDGSAWSALGSNGSGNGALNGAVDVLATDSGGNVYAGGEFTNAAGVPTADYLARWDGSGWSGLGSNGAGDGALNGAVVALMTWGDNIYVGGAFTNVAADQAADYVARWDGAGWASVGSNGASGGALNGEVHALAALGSALYLGGDFANAAGVPEADFVAGVVIPSSWSALGSNGMADGALNSYVSTMVVWRSDLYIGGQFTDVAGIPEADYIARWDGTSWSALGSNGVGDGALSHGVFAMVATDSALYVGGSFTDAGGVATADNLARWDGISWSGVGSNGAGDGALDDAVHGIAVQGDDIYVVGDFTNAGGDSRADYGAHWDGTGWSAIDASATGSPALAYPTGRIAVSGRNVYVASGQDITHWNGTHWSSLGGKVAGKWTQLNGSIATLVVSGSDLYVGGGFTDAGGVTGATDIARWDGTAWHAVASGGTGIYSGVIYAIAFSGNDVYVGGSFVDAAGNPEADRIARWDGHEWVPLGSNGAGDGVLNQYVSSLALDHCALFAGGHFTNANGIPMADFAAVYRPILTSAPDTAPPTVSLPNASLVSPATLSASARLQLDWPSACDPSGIESYKLQIKKGSGRWQPVSLASPTATSAVVALEPWRPYRFRLRATDTAGNSSAWATTTVSSVALLQENGFDYVGSWKRVALRHASGGYVKKTTEASATASYTFTGSSVALVSTLAPGRGMAEVWLDGVKQATLDLYSPTIHKKSVVWSSAALLAAGSHTIELRVLGTKNVKATKTRVDLDALLVWP